MSAVTKENYASLNYYQILGLLPIIGVDVEDEEEVVDYSAIELNLAHLGKVYRRATLKFHPDKDSSKEAESVFITLKTAYEVLTDTERRLDYDQELCKKNAHLVANINIKKDATDAEKQLQATLDRTRRAQMEKVAQRERDVADAVGLKAALQAELWAPVAVMEQELLREWGMSLEQLAVKEGTVSSMLFDAVFSSGTPDTTTRQYHDPTSSSSSARAPHPPLLHEEGGDSRDVPITIPEPPVDVDTITTPGAGVEAEDMDEDEAALFGGLFGGGSEDEDDGHHDTSVIDVDRTKRGRGSP